MRSGRLELFRDALLATLIPNLTWAYISWRYKLGVSPIYIWPWALLVTIWYGRRCAKLGVHSSRLGIVKHSFRDIRAVLPPFGASIFFSLLNFLLDPHIPPRSPAVVILISLASCLAYGFVSSVASIFRGLR